MKIQRLIWLVALPCGSLGAQVSVFERLPGQPGDVVVLGAIEERPSALQGIQLLPLECIGRTRLDELLPTSTRRRSDVPGAARLILPEERGSLYKFRRDDEATGSSVFGYFVVGPDGRARSVFELPGAGPSGHGDPIPGRVAIAAHGRALLVASSKAAGGDLWEVDLDRGHAVNRTVIIDTQDFHRNGLVLLDTWGLGISKDGVFRFDRAPLSQASAVGMPSSTRWFGHDVVRSEDLSTAAFVAGEGESLALVFTVRASGDAVQASRQPMLIVGAGFRPEEVTGPTLALSTDGSWVLWRNEGPSRECFARETAASVPGTDLYVTDTSFGATLNDSGVLAFIDPDSAIFVVGRRDDLGIDLADVYRLDLAPGGAFQVTNLSLTSGITAPPFEYGTFHTRYGLYRLPGPQPAFVLHDGVGSGSILWLDAAGTRIELLDRVQSLDSLDVAGSYVAAVATRPPGVADPYRVALDLLQIPHDGRNTLVVRLPEGCCVTRTVGSRTRDQFAGVLEFDNGAWLGMARFPTTSGLAASSSRLVYGPTTGATASGEILATVEVLAGRATFVWSDFGTHVIRTSRLDSFLLPGL